MTQKEETLREGAHEQGCAGTEITAVFYSIGAQGGALRAKVLGVKGYRLRRKGLERILSKRVAKTNLHCAHLPAAGIWRRLGQMVPGAVGEADCPEAEDLRGGFWEVNPLLISEPASRDRGPSLHPFTPIICSPHPHFSDLHFSPRLPFSPPSFRDLFLVIIALPLDR